MKWQRVILAVLVAAALADGLAAQGTKTEAKTDLVPNAAAKGESTPAAEPVVTDAMQSQFMLAAQSKEIWGLKVYQASVEYQKAIDAFDKLAAAMQRPGYDLRVNDQQKLEYVKQPDPKAPPK